MERAMMAYPQWGGERLAEPLATRSTVYYLVWRIRPSQPWRSEEFENRFDAHQRYFTLIERGVEAYLESRTRRLAG